MAIDSAVLSEAIRSGRALKADGSKLIRNVGRSAAQEEKDASRVAEMQAAKSNRESRAASYQTELDALDEKENLTAEDQSRKAFLDTAINRLAEHSVLISQKIARVQAKKDSLGETETLENNPIEKIKKDLRKFIFGQVGSFLGKKVIADLDAYVDANPTKTYVKVGPCGDCPCVITDETGTVIIAVDYTLSGAARA